MKTASYYINEIKKKGEFTSDYSIAKMLGVNRQAMTGYKKGGNFNDKAAFIVAEYLDIDPLLLIAEMNAQRARTAEDSGFWKLQIKKISNCAATVFGLSLTLPLFVSEAHQYILC